MLSQLPLRSLCAAATQSLSNRPSQLSTGPRAQAGARVPPPGLEPHAKSRPARPLTQGPNSYQPRAFKSGTRARTSLSISISCAISVTSACVEQRSVGPYAQEGHWTPGVLPARAGLINLDIGKLSFQLEFSLTVAVNLTAHYLRDGLEQRAHPQLQRTAAV